MTISENDPLIHQLLELVRELDSENIPIILGGGMSLYLRQRYMSARTPRYPFDVEARSTADLDLFLSSRLIADVSKIESLKQTILRLGYQVLPEAMNFQFAKEVSIFGQKRTVKIDLLSAPPEELDKAQVKISAPRIKPVGAEGIHAYLTQAAAGLEIGKIDVDVSRLDPDLRLKNQVLYIPSAFNFLILKLHAFEDRKNEKDSDMGRHHAQDIFATVIRMGEHDWAAAKQHKTAHGNQAYLRRAAEIRSNNFSRPTELGLLRLRENESYRRQREIYDKYLELLVQDLEALFLMD